MKLRRKGKRFLFILPNAVGMLTFYLIPLCYCALYAFSSRSGKFSFGGFGNFVSLFQSESFRMAFGNTYCLLLECVGTVLIGSLVLVYFLDATKKNLICLVVLALPMLLPPALITHCVADFEWPSEITLILIFIWKYLGFHVILLKAMELKMNPEWIDAAVIEHASKWQVYTKVRLPYLWPYIRFLFIFDGICFFRLFRESYLLYGKYPEKEVYTIINFFFNNFQNLNYQRLSAAAVITLVPLLIFNIALLNMGGKHEVV